MEPDIIDLAKSVQDYVYELLKREADEEYRTSTQETRQVNVRIAVELHDVLEQLATRFGMSKTAMAMHLLELAIIEADGIASDPAGALR